MGGRKREEFGMKEEKRGNRRESSREIVLHPIGVVRTEYRDMNEAPFQGRFSLREGVLEIFDEYTDGLKDVDGCSWLIVIYWAHLADRDVLQTVTPWGPEVRGVFACRSPSRPNPLNVCMVELVRREGDRLVVRGLDAVDGSPLIDVKPYSSRIDAVEGAGMGWFREKEEAEKS